MAKVVKKYVTSLKFPNFVRFHSVNNNVRNIILAIRAPFFSESRFLIYFLQLVSAKRLQIKRELSFLCDSQHKVNRTMPRDTWKDVKILSSKVEAFLVP